MNFILESVYFLVIALLAFYIPGYFFIKRIKLDFLDEAGASFAFGIVLWTFQGYVFGSVGVRDLTYLYLLFFLFNFFRNIRHYLGSFPKSIKVNLLDCTLVLIGSLFILTAVWFMGVKSNTGLFFCCRGVPDAIYHLSLTNSLIKEFPPLEPGMSNSPVKNYHFFSNLVSAEISRTFSTNFIDTQFRFLNIVLSILIGTFAFSFGRLLIASKTFARILAVLLYTTGDILYVLLFFRGSGFDFSTTIVDDATKLLAGPPRAFSVVILLWGIFLLTVWFKKNNWTAYLLSSLVFGSLVGFKIYTGIFALTGLGILTGFYFYKRRFLEVIPPIIAIGISVVYYFQFNKGAGGLKFSGLWRLENFSQHKDLLISKLDYLRIQATDNNVFLVVLMWIIIAFLYFVFLFGIVNFAFIQTKKSLRGIPGELILFMSGAICVSIILGLFFLQTTGGANTIQFLIGAYTIALIPAALSITQLFNSFKTPFKQIFLITVLVFASLRGVHEVANNVKMIANKHSYTVTNSELNALAYLNEHVADNATIVVEPWVAEDQPFMYISFLSNKNIFLLGSGVLRDHGQDIAHRQSVNNAIYYSDNVDDVMSLLTSNNINYLYLTPGIDLAVKDQSFLKKVYDDGEISILKLN